MSDKKSVTPRKPKTKRQRSKYPALDPTLNLKIRYDEIADIDYLHKLSHEEKKWLNKFMEESVSARLKKNNNDNLHNTPALKKACYDRNNARNRDIYSRSKARDGLVDIEEMKRLQLESETALESNDSHDELDVERLQNLDNSEDENS